MTILSPFDLPEGTVLLVTDEIASPGEFLLFKALVTHLKEKKGRVVVLSVDDDGPRWKAVASRSVDSGMLTFLDVSDIVQLHPSSTPIASSTTGTSSGPILKPVYDALVAVLEKRPTGESGSDSEESALIILDDVSVLEWIGVAPSDVWKFLRALSAHCAKLNATLIVRHHMVAEVDDEPLFMNLLQLCDYHLEVRSLASGRSGAVSGEVALHAGPSALGPRNVKLIPRSLAIHYRLTDTGVVFFERGTGGAVL